LQSEDRQDCEQKSKTDVITQDASPVERISGIKQGRLLARVKNPGSSNIPLGGERHPDQL